MNTVSTIINGVDRDALFGTIDAVKSQPSLAEFKFRVANDWVQGGLNRSRIEAASSGLRHKSIVFPVNRSLASSKE